MPTRLTPCGHQWCASMPTCAWQVVDAIHALSAVASRSGCNVKMPDGHLARQAPGGQNGATAPIAAPRPGNGGGVATLTPSADAAPPVFGTAKLYTQSSLLDSDAVVPMPPVGTPTSAPPHPTAGALPTAPLPGANYSTQSVSFAGNVAAGDARESDVDDFGVVPSEGKDRDSRCVADVCCARLILILTSWFSDGVGLCGHCAMNQQNNDPCGKACHHGT